MTRKTTSTIQCHNSSQTIVMYLDLLDLCLPIVNNNCLRIMGLNQYILSFLHVVIRSKSHNMMDFWALNKTMILFDIMKNKFKMRSNNFKTRAERTDKNHLRGIIENRVQLETSTWKIKWFLRITTKSKNPLADLWLMSNPLKWPRAVLVAMSDQDLKILHTDKLILTISH